MKTRFKEKLRKIEKERESMNTQTIMFDEQEGPITRKFKKFHRDNPHVYDELVRCCYQLKNAGCRRYGMKGIFEVIRWQSALKTNGSELKLNNNYTSIYSRMIMRKEPALRGFFETREKSEQII